MEVAEETGDLQAIVSEAFRQLSRDVALSLTDYSHISQCQHDLEQVLARYYPNFTTVLPGAYSRHTMTAPLAGSVIDLLILFNETKAEGSSPSAFVRKLHSTLRDSYSDSWLANRTVALIIKVDKFVFRIQPGFVTDQRHYLIPAQSWDGWEKHDSIGYKQSFARMNGMHKGKLLNVVLMMKAWNRLNGSVFDGYYVEILVVDVLKNYQIDNYAEALCEVFRRMVKQVVFKQTDPASPGIDIDGLRDVGNLVQAMQLVHTAYRVASQAIEYTKHPRSSITMTNWEKLFPGLWPCHS